MPRPSLAAPRDLTNRSGSTWAGLLGLAIASFAVVGVLVAAEVSPGAVLTYFAYVTLVIALPGLIVWNVVADRLERANPDATYGRTRLEDLVCGVCVGYALELPCYAVARWAGSPRSYIVVELVIVVLWAIKTKPWQLRPARSATWSAGPAAALGAIVAYCSVWMGVRVFGSLPLRLSAVPDTDDPFQLALIGELRHHFPGVYPYVPDEDLTYQYFFHLHAAASTWVTGLSSMEVFARFDPIVFMLLSVCGVACVASRLARRPWVGVVAAATLTLVGCFDASGLFRGQASVEDRYLSSLLVHSPTQAMAFAFVTPLVICCLHAADGRSRIPGSTWAMLFVLSVVMTGIKVTFVPMLVTGLAAAAIGLWLARGSWRPAALATGVTASALAACFLLLYRGQGRGLTWGPLAVTEHYSGFFQLDPTSPGARFYVLILLLVGVLAPVAGLIAFPMTRLREDPRAWFLLVAGISGLGANALLAHSGLSQRFFLYSSAWLLAVASAWGLSALFPPGEPRSVHVRAIATAGLAGLVLLGLRAISEPHSAVVPLSDGSTQVKAGLPPTLNLPILLVLVLGYVVVARLLRGTWSDFPTRGLVVAIAGLGLARAFAFLLGNVEPESTDSPKLSSGAIEVTDWLRDHSSPDEVVMTNAHCAKTTRADSACDNRHFWMSGLSERRFLIEGWGYTGRVVWEIHAPFVDDPALLVDNDRLFTQPTADSVERFVTEYGVGWMLADLSEPVDLERLRSTPGVQVAFESGEFAVLRLTDPGDGT